MNFAIVTSEGDGLAGGYCRGDQLFFPIPPISMSEWAIYFITIQLDPAAERKEGRQTIASEIVLNPHEVKEMYSKVVAFIREELLEYPAYNNSRSVPSLFRTVTVLGTEIVVDGTRIRSGLDKKLEQLGRLVEFLQKASENDCSLHLYTYVDATPQKREVSIFMKKRPNGVLLDELLSSFSERIPEVNRILQQLEMEGLVERKGDTIFPTLKGKFAP